MNIIDLFAGCGGLSLGFIQRNHHVKLAVEYDAAIASTYTHNHPDVKMVVDDIKNIDQTGLFQEGDADIIVGGPPCQGFSMAGARIRNGFIDDPRNYLFKHYFNIVKTVKPQIFVMENVKGIQTMQEGKIFKEILRIFSETPIWGTRGYDIHYKVVRAVDFGVPQKRERMIIIGTAKKIDNFDALWNETAEYIVQKHPDFFVRQSIREAIGNLPVPNDSGEICTPAAETPYQKFLCSAKGTIKNHIATKHSSVAISRMRRVAGGENFTVLDEKINSVHSGAYGRLVWEDQSPTITTRFDTPAGGRFIHPTEDRTLTPREAARIQSFPDDFEFCGSRTSICKQIGNAVPPKISYFLACLSEKIMERNNI